MTLQLKGIVPPLVTPFAADQELDERALHAEIRYLLDAGVHGLTVCGSTSNPLFWSTENWHSYDRLMPFAVDDRDSNGCIL